MATWRSKLGTEYPRDLVDRLDKEHHRMLKRLRAEPGNARCAECGTRDNTWASVNLGVFVCVRCADVHRHLGTHISKVKGCGGTYLWGPDEIAQMEAVGNRRAAELYCAGGAPEMTTDACKEALVDFCQKKYGFRLWAKKGAAAGAGAARDVSATVASKADCMEQSTEEAPKKPTQKRPERAPRERHAATPPPLPTLLHQPRATVRSGADAVDFDALFADLLGDEVPATVPRAEKKHAAPQTAPGSELAFLEGCFPPDGQPRVALGAAASARPAQCGGPGFGAPAWKPQGPESSELFAGWGEW